ncbi:MAG TPA: hypothetical protein DEO44_05050, partial [Verrucomicrobia subdivision 6 bacterium]|nr:hypothetical protein [Verrucomicrobia subdivision 6 bacterium]
MITGTTCCVFVALVHLGALSYGVTSVPTNLSLQEDGSLVVFDAKGGVAEFVKQGTPRQSIQLDGQACNVSYGFNSAGKQTILVSLPPSATGPVVFLLGESQVTIPPKAGLRITLNEAHKIEKMDGAPAGTVQFQKLSSPSSLAQTIAPPPTQFTPIPTPSEVTALTPTSQ